MNQKSISLQNKEHINVLTDSHLVTEYLKLDRFKFVKDLDQADIVFVNQNLKDDYTKFAEKFVNQFPFEACIVMKHHLANTIYSA